SGLPDIKKPPISLVQEMGCSSHGALVVAVLHQSESSGVLIRSDSPRLAEMSAVHFQSLRNPLCRDTRRFLCALPLQRCKGGPGRRLPAQIGSKVAEMQVRRRFVLFSLAEMQETQSFD
ncbi:hypothetical protein, partial [Adlercreutzia caecimuris]|uniref:hypothetical protein n=1 Tax=Adlercreutzia caecimuris TaxID=671266 RepID=UPI00272C1F64